MDACAKQMTHAQPVNGGNSARFVWERKKRMKPKSSEKSLQELAAETVTVDRRGEVIARDPVRAQLMVEPLPRGASLRMVLVPGGAFQMGSPEGRGYEDEWPQHRVTLRPFLLAQCLVTQEQWAVVVGKVPPHRFDGPQHPIDNVSWGNAQGFCRRLVRLTGRPYRLPSEAEWEYACRGGTSTPFSCGYTLTTFLANYNGEFRFADEPKGVYRHVTTEAGTFPQNPFGLHDMHGNLWEWCADAWHDSYRGAPVDSRAWESGGDASLRVLRGGSWHDTPDVCRSGARLKLPSAAGDEMCGFRVALSWEAG